MNNPARNFVARLTESSIALNIESTSSDTTQRIRFSRPGQRPGAGGPEIPEYLLPEEIMLVTTHDRFVFDPRGLVEKPGRIVLVSRVDDTITSTVEIN